MNILAVSGFSALALVLVHSITFVIGRRLGRYNVVDVAWGVGFVAVAAVAATLGHGDPTRRWLLLALVAIWGGAAELAHLPQDRRQGRRSALCRSTAKCLELAGGPQGLCAAGLHDAVRLVPAAAVGGDRSHPKAVAADCRARTCGLAGGCHLRSPRRSPAAGIQIRPGQSGRDHGPRSVGLDASPQLFRRCLRLVGVVVDHRQRLGAAAHGVLAAADVLLPAGRERGPVDREVHAGPSGLRRIPAADSIFRSPPAEVGYCGDNRRDAA